MENLNDDETKRTNGVNSDTKKTNKERCGDDKRDLGRDKKKCKDATKIRIVNNDKNNKNIKIVDNNIFNINNIKNNDNNNNNFSNDDKITVNENNGKFI